MKYAYVGCRTTKARNARGKGLVTYEIREDVRVGSNRLFTWHALNEQPYDWRPSRGQGCLHDDFVHCVNGIARHPIIDAHCKGNPLDAAELIVRFFQFLLGEEYHQSFLFFGDKTKDRTILFDGHTLTVSMGHDNGNIAEDRFCVYRENRDSLSLDFSFFWSQNAYGDEFDRDPANWEERATRQRYTLTFLCNTTRDVAGLVRECERCPDRGAQNSPFDDGDDDVDDDDYGTCYGTFKRNTRQVVQNPFDLDGYYLFERHVWNEFLGWEDEL